MNFLRSIQWASAIAFGMTGFLLGWTISLWLGKAVLDGGLATLVGSALGAGITVAGGMWAANYQTSLGQKSFERFAFDAIGAVRDECHILIAMTEREDFASNIANAKCLSRQVEQIKETINVFTNTAARAVYATYEAHLWVSRLSEQIRIGAGTFDKELGWLSGRVTDAVLLNARADLSYSAQHIFEGCGSAMKELNRPKRALPSDDEIRRRISQFGDMN